MAKPEDAQLFKEAMQDVVPLGQSSRIAPTKAPTQLRKPSSLLENEPSSIYIAYQEPVTGESQLSYLKENVDAKLLRQLKQGKIKPEKVIDLHGLTVKEAEEHLLQILSPAITARCVLIVHGKGKQPQGEPARVKSLVNQVLRSLPHVLAFCSARANDGGA